MNGRGMGVWVCGWVDEWIIRQIDRQTDMHRVGQKDRQTAILANGGTIKTDPQTYR